MTDPIIRVIDFETTGMAPPAQIVEVGICDLIRDGDEWTVGEPVSWLCGVREIPPETRAVHHITMAEVGDAAPVDLAKIAFDAKDLGVTCWAAHSAAFEGQWMTSDIPVICTYKAALRVWPDAPSHSNGALRYWLEDQGFIAPDPALCQPAHRAGPDAYVTAHILKALLVAASGREMVAWTREPRLLPTCPIGKQRGAKWADVDGGFLDWMLRQDSMEEDLKWLARRELDRRKMDQREKNGG